MKLADYLEDALHETIAGSGIVEGTAQDLVDDFWAYDGELPTTATKKAMLPIMEAWLARNPVPAESWVTIDLVSDQHPCGLGFYETGTLIDYVKRRALPEGLTGLRILWNKVNMTKTGPYSGDQITYELNPTDNRAVISLAQIEAEGHYPKGHTASYLSVLMRSREDVKR
jgi:hypothetical protein